LPYRGPHPKVLLRPGIPWPIQQELGLTTWKKNTAIAYMVNGFISQFIPQVTIRPFGFFVALTILENQS